MARHPLAAWGMVLVGASYLVGVAVTLAGHFHPLSLLVPLAGTAASLAAARGLLAPRSRRASLAGGFGTLALFAFLFLLLTGALPWWILLPTLLSAGGWSLASLASWRGELGLVRWGAALVASSYALDLLFDPFVWWPLFLSMGLALVGTTLVASHPADAEPRKK